MSPNPLVYRGRRGGLPASKSLLNRALVIQSYAPELTLIGQSSADDVGHMRRALEALSAGEREFDCGEAGTVIRFLAMRVSRLEGSFVLRGTPRLLTRPMEELSAALASLGARVSQSQEALTISGTGRAGWDCPERLVVDCRRSSQFATAVLVNAWGLQRSLSLTLQGLENSKGYWEMSVALARTMGMELEIEGDGVRIPARAEVRETHYEAEMDMDTAFALAAACAVSKNGSVSLTGFPRQSIQPSAVFVEILTAMGVPIRVTDGILHVESPEVLRAIDWDLSGAPDLFPVLSVVCAFAEGTSTLSGLTQLSYKESDRLENTRRLLEGLQVRSRVSDGRFSVEGGTAKRRSFGFDPDQDHRMAMAAGVARCAGADIEVQDPDVVNKSFPEFWRIVGASS